VAEPEIQHEHPNDEHQPIEPSKPKRDRESPEADPQAKRQRRGSPGRTKSPCTMDQHYLQLVDSRDRTILQVSLGSLEKPSDTPYWMKTYFHTSDIDAARLRSRRVDGRVTLGAMLDDGFELETLDGRVLTTTPMLSMFLDWIWGEVTGNPPCTDQRHVLRLRKR